MFVIEDIHFQLKAWVLMHRHQLTILQACYVLGVTKVLELDPNFAREIDWDERELANIEEREN